MTNPSWPRANTSYTMPTEGPKPCIECQKLQARLDGVLAENHRLKTENESLRQSAGLTRGNND